EHETTARVDSALLERARAEQAALQELWENTPARLLEQAGAPDLNALLRHLARRMFLSPRLKAVLQERLEPSRPRGEGGRRARTLRMTGRTHFLVAALVAGSLFSGVARAGQAPAQAPAPGLAAKWEDLLLLEAIRYLRLSPAQLEAMLPLARSAEDRLARLTQEAAAALATLEASRGRTARRWSAAPPGTRNPRRAPCASGRRCRSAAPAPRPRSLTSWHRGWRRS